MSMEGSWLPRDLLHCVVDHIDLKDKSSLLNVLASCRTLRAIVEPRFYHSAAFTINASRDHLRLGERIKGFYEQISKDHARLAPFVRQFTYVSGRSKTITADNSLLIKILPLLINLEYFRFSNFDLDVNNTCVLKFIRSQKLQTVIWACLLKQVWRSSYTCTLQFGTSKYHSRVTLTLFQLHFFLIYENSWPGQKSHGLSAQADI
ncbi:hypothetical protein ONZ45_g6310 [Pleurotus djamor]|nr:hypothetical protein ONZ45_g6310 [Pleurotus djamor]